MFMDLVTLLPIRLSSQAIGSIWFSAKYPHELDAFNDIQILCNWILNRFGTNVLLYVLQGDLQGNHLS